jgi:hypothetical protein
MHLSYKNVLKNAWQITWRNKILWIFGIFASFLSLEAAYEVILGQIFQLKKVEAFNLGVLNFYQTRSDFLKGHIYFLSNLTQDLSAYLFFILLFIVVLFFIWLIFTSQIFIIKSTAKLYQNKKVDTAHDLSGSYDKFWPVLGVSIITKLLLGAGFMIISLPLLYSLLIGNNSAIIASNILFFILFTIFAIIISFIAAYATNYVILKDVHVIEAFKRAWQLFSKNIIISLELAFVLFILKIVSIIIILSITFLGLIPLIFIFMLNLAANNILGIVMTLTLMLFLFSLISLLINSIFATLYLSTWTITFLKLNEGSLIGKLAHLANKAALIFKKSAKMYNVDIDKQKIKTESIKIAKEIKKQYKIIEPDAKRQGKAAAVKLKKAYAKIEPKLEKEIKKIIANTKKQNSVKTRSTAMKKTTTQKSSKAKRKTNTSKK